MFVCTRQRVKHTRVLYMYVYSVMYSDYPSFTYLNIFRFSFCSACIVHSIRYRISCDANIRKKVLHLTGFTTLCANVIFLIRGYDNIFVGKTHVVLQSSPSLHSVLGSMAIYFNLSVKGILLLYTCVLV
jgi:hypothetical protein